MDQPASGPSAAFTAVKNLGHQLRTGWHLGQSLELPGHYRSLLNIIIAGMGGSHLSGDIIASVLGPSMPVPLYVHHDYYAPGYVGPQTLCLATSYSGNTEEILNFTQEAVSKGAPVITIGTGARLAQLASSLSIPSITFDDQPLNPGRVPRYGNGYLLGIQLGILRRLDLIGVSQSDIDQAAAVIDDHVASLDPSTCSIPTSLDHLCQQLAQHQLILISASHLSGPAYFFKNQLNESAKLFADLFTLPELNHHLLEGLQFPSQLHRSAKFLFLRSSNYSPRIQQRFHITKVVLEKQAFVIHDLQLQPAPLLTEAADLMAQASLISLRLSQLHQVDPTPNPWVDFFKSQLA